MSVCVCVSRKRRGGATEEEEHELNGETDSSIVGFPRFSFSLCSAKPQQPPHSPLPLL